jgi:putative ABC transport system permease protein
LPIKEWTVNLLLLVKKEMFERKTQLMTSFLAIFLGISVIVAVRNINIFSEKIVSDQLSSLGANIMILPKSMNIQNYYNADLNNETIPEDYINILADSSLSGVENFSPKLSSKVQLSGKDYILTGILPVNEIKAKQSWEGKGIFSNPATCGIKTPVTQQTQVRRNIIDELGENEALIGFDVSQTLGIVQDQEISVNDKKFKVISTLPMTGTIDDTRIFVNLKTAQEMTGNIGRISAIEVVGCCQEISKGLINEINRMVPDAKVITITQIVDTQIKMNKTMSDLSLLLLILIMLIGGATIANYMFTNVFERRKELGTLLAMGASSSMITYMLMIKALFLGVFGGIAGYLIGSGIAMALGPSITGGSVTPLWNLGLLALAIAVLTSIIASIIPAFKAANVDPTVILQEV